MESYIFFAKREARSQCFRARTRLLQRLLHTQRKINIHPEARPHAEPATEHNTAHPFPYYVTDVKETPIYPLLRRATTLAARQSVRRKWPTDVSGFGAKNDICQRLFECKLRLIDFISSLSVYLAFKLCLTAYLRLETPSAYF